MIRYLNKEFHICRIFPHKSIHIKHSSPLSNGHAYRYIQWTLSITNNFYNNFSIKPAEINDKYLYSIITCSSWVSILKKIYNFGWRSFANFSDYKVVFVFLWKKLCNSRFLRNFVIMSVGSNISMSKLFSVWAILLCSALQTPQIISLIGTIGWSIPYIHFVNFYYYFFYLFASQ